MGMGGIVGFFFCILKVFFNKKNIFYIFLLITII
jgi:hypothetical protein